jgi:peptidoglycan/LPS O-acetylase OafA/YrhL
MAEAPGVRLAGLDALRALAVALVVVDHATGRFAGGGVGVAVFFVLSGYLITSLLLRERERHGRIHLGLFYLRRALRLWPALLAMLAACVVLHASWRAALVAGTYLTDVANALGKSEYPFGHTWSLGVEEQFYLVWPLALIVVARWRRAMLTVLGAAALASVVGCAMWTAHSLRATGEVGIGIFNPLWQAHGLLIGCALAVVGGSWRLRRPGVGSGLAAVAVVAVAFAATLTVSRHWALWWNVAAELCAVLAIVGLRDVRTGPFTWRPAVWLGERSYAVYLWHLPLILLITARHVPAGAALAVVLALVAAEVSARYVEAPFLRLKDRLHPGGPRAGLDRLAPAVAVRDGV